MRTYALYPLIDKPTRVCASSQTLIDDNIFTDAIFEEFHSGILHTDISDHLPICAVHKERLKTGSASRNNEYFRKFTTYEIRGVVVWGPTFWTHSLDTLFGHTFSPLTLYTVSVIGFLHG